LVNILGGWYGRGLGAAWFFSLLRHEHRGVAGNTEVLFPPHLVLRCSARCGWDDASWPSLAASTPPTMADLHASPALSPPALTGTRNHGRCLFLLKVRLGMIKDFGPHPRHKLLCDIDSDYPLSLMSRSRGRLPCGFPSFSVTPSEWSRIRRNAEEEGCAHEPTSPFFFFPGRVADREISMRSFPFSYSARASGAW